MHTVLEDIPCLFPIPVASCKLSFLLTSPYLIARSPQTDGKASQRERDLLAPRKYQLEILAEARQRNTIAYLETGTGKTLISVLLIKALSADLRKRNGRKLAAFIVPLVPLVHQVRIKEVRGA